MTKENQKVNLSVLNPYNIIQELNEEMEELRQTNKALADQVEELAKSITITSDILKGLKNGKLIIVDGEIVDNPNHGNGNNGNNGNGNGNGNGNNGNHNGNGKG